MGSRHLFTHVGNDIFRSGGGGGQSLGGDDQVHTGRGALGKARASAQEQDGNRLETSVTMSVQVVLELDVFL